MAVLAVLGFSSGLPLLLTSQLLKAWATAAHVELDRIAALSLVGLAYTLKFLWAPLLDRIELPWLGRRRGWVLVFQLGLMLAIGALATTDPGGWAFIACAVIVAFLSASQDVVLDAYSTDLLAPHERAAGVGVYVLGYRAAMLGSAALALVLADHIAWRTIYTLLAAGMAIGIAGTLVAEEPAVTRERARGGRLVPPVAMLAFAALYELGYFYGQSLVIPFLKDGLGFDFTQIAEVYKVLGFAGLAIGGVIAGVLGTRRLVTFGVLAAATHLLYAVLALTGRSMPVFCIAVLADSIANAMATAAFLSVLMSACSPAASATQFAVLTSLASVGERVLGWTGSHVVHAVGWAGFFAVSAAAAIPGIILAIILRPGADPRSVET